MDRGRSIRSKLSSSSEEESPSSIPLTGHSPPESLSSVIGSAKDAISLWFSVLSAFLTVVSDESSSKRSASEKSMRFPTGASSAVFAAVVIFEEDGGGKMAGIVLGGGREGAVEATGRGGRGVRGGGGKDAKATFFSALTP